MKLKEQISFEEVCGQAFKIRVVEASEYGKAAFTHYLHNHQNGVSLFYKKEAVQYVKRALEYKSGRAFRSNLFVRSSQKGFPFQSLTQIEA